MVETRGDAWRPAAAPTELAALERQAEHLIKALCRRDHPVRVVEPGTIERSQGKAKRVIDRRPKK